MFADDTQIATSSDDIKIITETLNRDLTMLQIGCLQTN
jgi:hypothetical protein